MKNSAMPLFLWPWFCIVSSTMALMESRELQNDAMKESTLWSWILASLSQINRIDSIWVRTVSVAFLCILLGWGYDFSKRSFWFSNFFFSFLAYLFCLFPDWAGGSHFTNDCFCATGYGPFWELAVDQAIGPCLALWLARVLSRLQVWSCLVKAECRNIVEIVFFLNIIFYYLKLIFKNIFILFLICWYQK